MKGKKGVSKVKKTTKPKKIGVKAISKANQKGKAKDKQVAVDTEKGEPEPELEPEPEPEPNPEPNPKSQLVNQWQEKAKSDAKGKTGVSKVQKSTKPKEQRGIKAARKKKQKEKREKAAKEANTKDETPAEKTTGKGKGVAAGETEGKQVQTGDKGKGKGKVTATDKGAIKTQQRFTRADLQETGALESEDVQMPTLTNDIHPIWAPQKFRFASGTGKAARAEAYAAISPALRLASLWIEQPQYEGFWADLWHGKYDKPGRNGLLMRISPLTEEQATKIKQRKPAERLACKEFRDFARREDFQCEWRFAPKSVGVGATTEEGLDGFSGCVTTLHDDFEWLIRYPRPGTTTSDRLRLFFFLAINLGRELVQHVCQFRHRDQYGAAARSMERNHVLYQSGERSGYALDAAWEISMFGGSIRQIGAPNGPMAPDGLAVHHFKTEDDPERVYMPVRVDWISERFSKGLWLGDESGRDRTLPGLPDGSEFYAKSLMID